MAVKLVNNIMAADVADATAGWIPMASISGPLMIPPPIPNIPAKIPATVLISGYTIVDFESHRISSSK